MKLSILLPTRDRLELLRHAVNSVRRLDDPDYEVVISDNCSPEDIRGYVDSLEDPRIRYVRAREVLSVTENWNNALKHSTGDYVIMLGDDDALLKDYSTTVRQLIADFDSPQVIYHNVLCYAYPGVIPGEPDGFLRGEGYATFLRDGPERPFRLPRDEGRLLARAVANFKLGYGMNSQFVTISRGVIDELSGDGGFYRSPFPDYYSTNHLFSRARSIVAEPRPLVVIGVSSSSHGFYVSNNREAEARAFLNDNARSMPSTAGQSVQIPGTNINDGWLRAVEELYRQLGCPADLEPNYRRYRMLQIVHTYNGHHLRGIVSADEVLELQQHMTLRERLLYGLLFFVLSKLRSVLPARARPQVSRVATLISRQFPWWSPMRYSSHYRDISEVVEQLNGGCDSASWRDQRGSRLRTKLLWRIFP
jgi:hypothetical protein